MSTELALPLVSALVIGVGAGYVGSLMVLRRMALVGDALSHVALPGIAVALLAEFNPFLGAFGALAIAVVIIWALERRTALPSETIVGIIFTLSLALGLLLTPEPELLEALFGDIADVTMQGVLIAIAAVVVIGALIARQGRTLVLGIVSDDLARTSGRNVSRANLLFMLAVALVVALGIKIAGTLLTGALVIIPAAAARNISGSLTRYMALSAVFGALSGIGGVALAAVTASPPGPLIILTSGVIFGATLLFKR
ncbi:MAG TPA: metal ABC transporter permease [Candidatus Paceibacterota bacterium]|nr:metal ABC transporter permease [Candidatus Paceibacterota bacterium]